LISGYPSPPLSQPIDSTGQDPPKFGRRIKTAYLQLKNTQKMSSGKEDRGRLKAGADCARTMTFGHRLKELYEDKPPPPATQVNSNTVDMVVGGHSPDHPQVEVEGEIFHIEPEISSFETLSELDESYSLTTMADADSFSLVNCSLADTHAEPGQENDVESEEEGAPVKDPLPTCFLCGKIGGGKPGGRNSRVFMKLTKKCRHPSACFGCLRRRCIFDAQKDISQYPLTCFGPGCGAGLNDTHIEPFIDNIKERSAHHRMARRARGIRKAEQRSEPDRAMEAKILRTFDSECIEFLLKCERLSTCPGCSQDVPVKLHQSQASCGGDLCDPYSDVGLTIAEIGLVTAFGAAPFSRCPSCHYVVFKGEGCDEMTCFCGREFSFKKYERRFRYEGVEIFYVPVYVPGERTTQAT